MITNKRALEVLKHYANGFGKAETAKRMKLSPTTVTNYRQRAIEDLQAKNTTHAVAIAIRMDLI